MHQQKPFAIGNGRFTLTRVTLRDNRYLNFQYSAEVNGVGDVPGGVAPLRIKRQNANEQPLIAG
jgi:hypothetical protein